MRFERRYRLQPRDVNQGLKHVVRFGACTAEQLARDVYGGSLAVAQRRIRALRQNGLVQTFAAIDNHSVVAATKKGAAKADLGINAMPLSRAALMDLGHTLQTCDLAAFIVRTEQARIMSEREFRCRLRVAKVSKAWPIPDLIIQVQGFKSVFVELELSDKSTTKLRARLVLYNSFNQPVRFYFAKLGAKRRLDTLVTELGLGGLVQTYIWNSAEETASE